MFESIVLELYCCALYMVDLATIVNHEGNTVLKKCIKGRKCMKIGIWFDGLVFVDQSVGVFAVVY